jgi:hypothetical protein
MALVIGSEAADEGMSAAIFTQLDRLLSPALLAAVEAASGEAKAKAQEALDTARDQWRGLAFAIATGVVSHLLSNLEVVGVRTRGDVSASGSGNTGALPPGPHAHPFTVTATQAGLVLVQSNDGTGRIR